MFGRSIRETRRSVGFSLEEAAPLSGVRVSEWEAIEAGDAPENVNRLRAVADTMGSVSTGCPRWLCSAGRRGG